MSFAQLKKGSGEAGRKKLSEELEKLNSKQGKEDDNRFWKPTVDKSGNGSALIRFLPPAEGEQVPWVKLFNHAFQGPGGAWYIENSLTTLNQKDPVSEYNTELWNSGIDANKETARKQKRKLNFIANVLVLKDPGNTENEGKVFLFKFGKKIFDKINDLMHPDNTGFEPDDEDNYKHPVNPFDLWEGASFKLRVRKVDGYPNYDKSEFSNVGPAIEGGDEVLEQLWNKEHKLEEFVSASSFKSYDELKAKLDRVLGLNGQKARASNTNVAAQAEARSTSATDTSDDSGDTSASESDLSFLEGLVEKD